MIYVVRPSEPDAVREALAKRGRSDNKTELEKAREYYSKTPLPTKAFAFTQYKEEAVCRALDDLFNEKCAYCESRYRAVDARNVEHYRPKGGVTESPNHQGYWWLAASWNNLLPSCPPCNQHRYHTIFDSDMSIEEFDRAYREKPDRLSGKGNSFPVRNNNWVTKENEDISVEDPLLINPCERNPENHLEFEFNWNRTEFIWEAEPIYVVVRPKLLNGVEDHYAKTSIDIYGLNRAGLFRERTARVKELQFLCQPIIDIANDLEEPPSPDTLVCIQNRLRKYKSNLEALTNPDQPYAGMAKAFVVLFEAELKRCAAGRLGI